MKTWTLAATPGGSAGEELARSTGLPPSLCGVLAARGIGSSAALDRFLNPRLSDLADPFLLPDMEAAVDRLWMAIKSGQTILVHGDYDVDGVTSSALASLVLEQLGARVIRHLPHRMEDGYGLSLDSVARCAEAGGRGSVILSTDCGSSSHATVEAARQAGIDVVVTDHHEIDGAGPAKAFAVVNPKLGTDASARRLAGVGVAFKLCHALLKRGREKRIPQAAALDLRAYLDLVAIGTVSDVVPLLDENRILVKHGLLQLNRRERPGLRALAEVAGIKGEIGTYHLAYAVGPRMNAAGRLGDAHEAMKLVLAGGDQEARVLAELLEERNRQRRRIEAEILAAAVRQIEGDHDPTHHFGIVAGDEGWHIGVIGIVASRLVSRYGCPAVVIGFDNQGGGRGSCRSVEGFNLLDGLKSCESWLSRYGGHGMAAGLEVTREHFEAFKQGFRSACAATLQGGRPGPVLKLDGWLPLAEAVEASFAEHCARLGPFGEGNPEPVWGIRGVEVLGPPKIVGESHLKFRVGQGSRSCEVIGFNMAERLESFPAGPLDLAAQVRTNTYLGRTTLQLQLLDLRAGS